MNTTTWGGRRENAGPHTLQPGTPTIKIEVRLPVTLAKIAEEIGEGNRSLGIRIALEAFSARMINTEDD